MKRLVNQHRLLWPASMEPPTQQQVVIIPPWLLFPLSRLTAT